MNKSTDRTAILYVHSSADLYGSDRCLLDLVKRLDRNKYAAVAVLPYRGDLSEELEKAGARVVHLDPWVLRKTLFRSGGFARYCLALPAKVRSLMTIIRDEGIGLVHSNSGVVLGGAVAAKLCGVPHVWHLREFFFGYPILWPAYALLMGVLSDRIICISNAVASQLPPAARAKAEVVHDGIDCEEFDPSGRRPDTGGGPERGPGGPVVANIGRISEIKGQDVFIRAAADVLNVHPRTRFLIIGDVFPGHEGFRRKLAALVETLALDSHVVLAGFRREIPRLLKDVDIVVLTTRIPEGLGLSLLEAMAFGKAVVSSRGGGSDEAVQEGVTGLLVPPGDYRALAGAIITLLSDDPLRAKMGAEGRRRVRERFTVERTTLAIQRIYQDILEDECPA